MRRILLTGSLVALLACSGVAIAQHGDSLTVDEAIAQALARHPLLRQAEAEQLAAMARTHQAESGALPHVAVAADYTRLSPVAEFSIPGLGNLPLFPENALDAHLAVSQTILDFGRTSAAVEVSRAGVDRAANAVRADRVVLARDTRLAFFRVLVLRRSLAVQDQRIAALEEHLRITVRKVESGSATAFDTQSTEVRIAQARIERVDLAKALRDEEMTLRRLTGMPWDAPVLLRGALEEVRMDPGLDSALARARADRPDVVAARTQLDAAHRQAHVAALHDVPRVVGHAAYGVKNGYEPNLDALRGNWSAGVTLEVPLFNGFEGASAQEEAGHAERAAEEHLRDVERFAEADVRLRHADIASAQEKILALGIQVAQSDSAVANARVQYGAGAGTNLDLLDAETNAATSRLQLLQARYQLMAAWILLDAAVGAFAR